MTTVAIDGPATTVTIEILRDEDWRDLVPQLLDRNDGTGAEIPLDLTGVTLELYIRPIYDSGVLIKKLWSPDGGILIDDASQGLATFYLERPTVIAELPIGTWQQFLLVKEPSDDLDGFAYRELWRGPLIVHPGRTEFFSLDFSDPFNSQYLPLIGLFGG